MSIDLELKKEGIEIIKKLDTLTINSIAKNVSEKLVAAFPNQNLEKQDLFMKLSRLDMYVTKMSEGLSTAKYYYKNTSIYFNETIDLIDLEDINIYAIHECLHYLQEKRNEKGKLIQLGLCDFSTSSLPGMALNEAAVQLMSSLALHQPTDSVKYFDITLPTISPSYYALECNLIAQMAYITGYSTLFNSTLNSNSAFKDAFTSLTNKHAYSTIEHCLDNLMYLEDDLANENLKLANEDELNKISKISKRIEKLRNKINELFIQTQNYILTSYFDSAFELVQTEEQVEAYRKKLYNYKNYIGTTQNYTFFNDYYINKMVALESKTNSSTALVPTRNGLFSTLFKKIRTLFRVNSEQTNTENIRNSSK